MGLLRRLLDKLTGSDSNSSLSSGSDNYICGACRSTFERQHQNCPKCGSPVLVPVEEADTDERRL